MLARDTFGKKHIFLRLVDIEAKKFFLESADVVSREAFHNIATRTEIDALNTMGVEAPGDRTSRLTTLLHGGGEVVSVLTQGSTCNQQFRPKG